VLVGWGPGVGLATGAPRMARTKYSSRMSLWNGITPGSAQGPRWEAQVNKGKIRMAGLTDVLNARDANGYVLHQIYEQDGNTVAIWHKLR